MWFGVLGPLLVRDEDQLISVPAGRQRVLLALLVVRAGSVVPADAAADVVWDGTPPDGAATTLRSHVMRLRRALGEAAGARIVTRYPGYLLQAGPDEVDALRFRGLCGEGGAAVRAGEWARAWDVLAEAQGLWRGHPLADVPSELLRRDEGPALEQLRLEAAEWRADAGLRLDHHAELVPELQSLAARYPLRERFHALLMLALVRSGRQAEALDAYQRARDVLTEELGTEPGAELRELHHRILAEDHALVRAAHSLMAADQRIVTPRQLPAPVAHFTGRASEMAALTGLLDRYDAGGPRAVVISIIEGTAGAGKTALAVRWAHQVADRFPDGQLYVNLRGYDRHQPMTSSDALARFLRALGVGGQDIAAEEDERAAQYRSLLADRRMLVVLDNAGSVEQVRPLLPGGHACAVVVTSRDSLAGLVAREGAARLDLGLLPPDEAAGLLRALIGARVDADPAAAEVLAALCCRLPLALRVAAELAARRPGIPLAELARELADSQQRLDLLQAGGDALTAVRAVFSWSYRHLDAESARTFRLLGLHPEAGFDSWVVAAITGTDLSQVRGVLDRLIRAHLVQPTARDRYGMHDLLRGYAGELAAQSGQDEREPALSRLFDHYLHTAATAMDMLFPADRHRRPDVLAATVPGPPLNSIAAARAWLAGNRAALVAVIGHAAASGWPARAAWLALTVFRYLDTDGYHHDALDAGSHALAAARQTGDRAAEALALLALGSANWRLGRYRDAEEHLQEALAACREAGDQPGQARALSSLGVIESCHGRQERAAGYHRKALAILHQTGDRLGEARTTECLGGVLYEQGNRVEAARHQQEALRIYRELGELHGEGSVLRGLGTVEWSLGHYEEAAGRIRQALAISRKIGDRLGQAGAFGNLGAVEWWQGRYEQAAEHQHEAVEIFRTIGNAAGEAAALNAYGEALCAAGRLSEAQAAHGDALAVAERAGDRYHEARAHDGLGYTCHADGDLGQAGRHWERALAIYVSLGAADAAEARARLSEVRENKARPNLDPGDG
jgi:DNA-binding SARP family transcriptional activator/Tfp pilus assembly protein PilF